MRDRPIPQKAGRRFHVYNDSDDRVGATLSLGRTCFRGALNIYAPPTHFDATFKDRCFVVRLGWLRGAQWRRGTAPHDFFEFIVAVIQRDVDKVVRCKVRSVIAASRVGQK